MSLPSELSREQERLLNDILDRGIDEMRKYDQEYIV